MAERDRMQILIAYDGSEGAESAIDDLKRAGLPRRADAIVLTIAEELFPLPASIGGVETTFAKSLLEEGKASLALAGRARSRILTLFPGWEILAEAGIGSPGSEIIARADEWRPNLIVVGSHGRTALGRMFFGSVPQKVINEARCSARVARGRIVEPNVPARLIVGVDGSEWADAAVAEIASRDWPDGSEVRIVNSAWTIPPASDPAAALGSEQPAAALLDIDLPDRSGLDLLREIKRRSPQTVVIMITAETLYENAVAALRGGADDFIGKPINLGELRFALDHAIKLKRQGRAPEAVSRTRILIISDSAERIPHLQAGFDSQEVEVASAVFPEEWRTVSGERHDLAVIDVCPALLEPLLGTIRASKEHSEIPVLVEQSRIAVAPLAGVLPKYRAMPCSHNELIRLARRQGASITGHERTKALL